MASNRSTSEIASDAQTSLISATGELAILAKDYQIDDVDLSRVQDLISAALLTLAALRPPAPAAAAPAVAQNGHAAVSRRPMTSADIWFPPVRIGT